MTQPLKHILRLGQPLGETKTNLAVISKGRQGGGWYRIDGIRSDQLFDVVGVGIARIFGAGAGPEQPLHLGAFGFHDLKLSAVKELLK